MPDEKPISEVDIFPGARLTIDAHGEIRVMAVAEGYVMARRKGAMPDIWRVNELAIKARFYAADLALRGPQAREGK